MRLRRRMHRIYRHIVFRPDAFWAWSLFVKFQAERIRQSIALEITP